MEYYFIAHAKNKNSYEIAKFSEYKEPDSVWTLRDEKRIVCDCPGAWRRRTCRHMKLFNFWKKNLDSQIGMALWFDGDDIEYKRMFDFKQVNTLLEAV